MTRETMGVVGAGIMGRSLALELSCHGYSVVLHDCCASQLEHARRAMTDALRMTRFARPDLRAVPDDALFERISFVNDLSRMSEVSGLVFENVTEDVESKRPVFEQLEAVCPPPVVLASNTSCIPITRIASWLATPERVIGLHWFNPVARSALVEVVRGAETSAATFAAATELVRSLGKDFVAVGDSPGFVSNRVLMLAINECALLVEQQVGSPAEIDKLFRQGLSHEMGPLATADLIGLDTVLASIAVLHDAFKGTKYQPAALLRQMVEAGKLGRKSGEGFFPYRRA